MDRQVFMVIFLAVYLGMEVPQPLWLLPLQGPGMKPGLPCLGEFYGNSIFCQAVVGKYVGCCIVPAA